jgi:hypothetical protein
MKWIAGLCIAGVLGAASVASAHPLDLGYLTLGSEGDRVTVQLDLELAAAATAVASDERSLDAGAIGARAGELAGKTFARAPIQTEHGPCTWTGASASLAGRTVSLHDVAVCPAGARSWAFPVVAESAISPRFQLMVKETVAGSERLTLVDKTSPHLAFAAPGGSSVGFGHFVWSGIAHIGAAPEEWHRDGGGLKLPDGIDHILFLLALLLGGGTLLQMIGIASGFTLGHSLTLALSALDVVHVPGRLIESLVALTIALAAVEAFAGRLKPHRWKIAAAFGLVHGFAFASALGHLELTTHDKVTALFGFNFGVEIGQVVIVLAAAPLVLLAQRHPREGVPATKAAAAAIFACGVYWFVVRALG